MASSSDIRPQSPRTARGKARRCVPLPKAKPRLTTAEIDRSRASSRKGVLGGSLFADATPTAPPELQPLLAAHQTLSRTDAKASTATGRFETDDAKAHDSRVEPKSLPARAAQLAALLTTLGEAETSVAEGVRARQLVVEQLERLLQDNRGALRRDEETMAGLRVKRAGLEREWAAVEDSIVRGLEAAPPATGVDVVDVEALRPAMEPLTPPPVESLTPVGSPKRARAPEPPASTMPPPPAASAPDLGSGASLLEIARDMDLRRSAGAGAGASAEPAAKRRRVDAHADEFDGLQGDALGSIDPDVAAMLARD
jgi:regulator of Ty1 transposition protein 103